MLKNAYLGAKIGFDAAENDPPKIGKVCKMLLVLWIIKIGVRGDSSAASGGTSPSPAEAGFVPGLDLGCELFW